MGTVTLIESVAGIPSTQLGTDGAAHVAAPSDIPGAGVQFIIRDLSTTLQTLTIPSGAKSLVISYRLLPGATATANQFAKYVINAANAAVAAGLLATDNAFIPLFQGDDHVISFSPGSEATSIDIRAEQAVGSEKTAVSVRGVI